MAAGLSHDELRAIRLLTRVFDPPSDAIYLAHIERIARRTALVPTSPRVVKRADLADRASHPSTRPMAGCRRTRSDCGSWVVARRAASPAFVARAQAEP